MRVVTPRFRLASGRTFTLREALLVTAASAVVPGLAQLRSGRRRTGITVLAAYSALAAAAALPAAVLTEALPRPERQALTVLGPPAAAAAWAALLLFSYRSVRPPRPALPVRAGAWGVVAVLCALAAAPPLVLARHRDHPAGRDHAAQAAQAAPTAHAGPARPAAGAPAAGAGTPELEGARRLNLLLMTAGIRGPGPRAGRLTLASVDIRTGDTVLLTLPGGLRHLPVPDVPAATSLDSVYAYGLAHPRLGGHRANPGAELAKRAVGRVVGMPVEYYRVVGARDFRRIVGATRTAWRCDGAPLLIRAGRARPHAAGHGATARTDIPRRLPPPLAALAAKVRTARISRVRLGTPQAQPGHRRPGYGDLRAAAGRAVTAAGVPAPSTAPHHESHIPGDTCR
jgi:hypothetical protein